MAYILVFAAGLAIGALATHFFGSQAEAAVKDIAGEVEDEYKHIRDRL